MLLSNIFHIPTTTRDKIPAFFCIPIVVLYPEFQLSRSYGVTRVFFKAKNGEKWPLVRPVTFDLLTYDLDLWHSTRYTQDTSSVKISDWYSIGKMVKSCWLTDSLTASLTHQQSHFNGWAMPPKKWQFYFLRFFLFLLWSYIQNFSSLGPTVWPEFFFKAENGEKWPLVWPVTFDLLT